MYFHVITWKYSECDNSHILCRNNKANPTPQNHSLDTLLADFNIPLRRRRKVFKSNQFSQMCVNSKSFLLLLFQNKRSQNIVSARKSFCHFLHKKYETSIDPSSQIKILFYSATTNMIQRNKTKIVHHTENKCKP